jgi:hypothetical protein
MRWIMILLVAAAATMVTAADAAAQRGAPPFCRNGEGHPVHGRTWCVQKGFALGGGVVWRQTRWDDAVLRRGRTSGDLTRAVLLETLGQVVLGRLEGQRRQLRATAPLRGRWAATENGGSLLRVYAGSTPVAELADWNNNGRFDLVLLNSGRR